MLTIHFQFTWNVEEFEHLLLPWLPSQVIYQDVVLSKDRSVPKRNSHAYSFPHSIIMRLFLQQHPPSRGPCLGLAVGRPAWMKDNELMTLVVLMHSGAWVPANIKLPGPTWRRAAQQEPPRTPAGFLTILLLRPWFQCSWRLAPAGIWYH